VTFPTRKAETIDEPNYYGDPFGRDEQPQGSWMAN
jgi:hypothetical protein